MVQKYLAIIDLTGGKRTESTDQSIMLSALIERVKGISQALNGHNSRGTQPDQASNLSVLELYAW
jgi:mediator of RNA polymerase II transcription subunit 12